MKKTEVVIYVKQQGGLIAKNVTQEGMEEMSELVKAVMGQVIDDNYLVIQIYNAFFLVVLYSILSIQPKLKLAFYLKDSSMGQGSYSSKMSRLAGNKLLDNPHANLVYRG